MAKLVVVGAGAMGLAAAYHAAKAGHEVDVVEAGPVAGGMAAHFDFDGLSMERYYHFICKPDQPTFDLLAELGISDKLKWTETRMGYFIGGKLHKFGDPISLVRFNEISLASRIRYGLLAFISTKVPKWHAIENVSAKHWITDWAGKEVYEKLWKPLFDLKFYEYADNISAQWIWTRIKRIGRSRKSLFQEQLGYLEGGSETLVNALCDAIRKLGGRIHLSAPVTRITTANGRVTGVESKAGTFAADHVISTVPTPYIPTIVPDLSEADKAKYRAIDNIGVACLVFKLKRSVTPYFWLNITNEGSPIPGIIEFSQLRPLPDTVVYVPYYMPTTHEKFRWPDQKLLDEAFGVMQQINPELTRDDIIATQVSRLDYAQPLCEPGFAAKIPPIQTEIAGLQIADTCFYYPEDRGVSEGARIAKEMAERVGA